MVSSTMAPIQAYNVMLLPPFVLEKPKTRDEIVFRCIQSYHVRMWELAAYNFPLTAVLYTTSTHWLFGP